MARTYPYDEPPSPSPPVTVSDEEEEDVNFTTVESSSVSPLSLVPPPSPPIFLESSKASQILFYDGYFYSHRGFTSEESMVFRCSRSRDIGCQGSITLGNVNKSNWRYDFFIIGDSHNHGTQDVSPKGSKKKKVESRMTKPTKKAPADVEGARPLLSEALTKPIVVKNSNGTSILKHNGHCYYMSTSFKQTTYCKCTRRMPDGCQGSITLQNLNKNDGSFDSFKIYHAHNHAVQNVKGKDKKMKRKVKAKEASQTKKKVEETITSNQEAEVQVCLLCSGSVPSTGALDDQRPRSSSSSNNQYMLKPEINWRALEFICKKLDLDWSEFVKMKEGGERISLPLCVECEKDYQEIVKLNNQFKIFEDHMNKGVQVIRDRIKGSAEVEGAGRDDNLNAGYRAFRKMVIETTPPIPDSEEEHLAKIRRQQERRRKLRKQRDPDFAAPSTARLQMIKQRSLKIVDRRRRGRGQQWNSNRHLNAGNPSEEFAVTGTSMERTQPSQTSKKLKKRRRRQNCTCHICEVIIPGPHRNFMQHYKESHPNEQRFSCKYCGQRFPAVSQVMIHQRLHTGDKPFNCKDCGKCFISQRNLNSHANTHKDFVHVCKACGMTFRAILGFQGHNHTQHDDNAECTERTSDLSEENLKSLGVAAPVKYRYHCHLCGDPIAALPFLRRHFTECHQDHCGDFLTCRCGVKFDKYRKVYNHSRLSHSNQQQ